MAREERAPRPGQGTPLGDANYQMRTAIGQYYGAADDEERSLVRQILVKRANSMLALVNALPQ